MVTSLILNMAGIKFPEASFTPKSDLQREAERRGISIADVVREINAAHSRRDQARSLEGRVEVLRDLFAQEEIFQALFPNPFLG